MPKQLAAVEVTEDQVLYFRSRRSHLAGLGARDAAAAARAILGAQAQQEAPALLALSLRTKGRPTAAMLKAQLGDDPRKLVRTWGQRDTLHVYDAAADWPLVVSARGEWQSGSRRGVMPTEKLVDKAAKVLDAASGTVTRRDLFAVLPKKYIQEAEAKVGAGDVALRLAAGRLLWCLARRGDVCMAEKIGSEQAYATRSAWFPKLPWPTSPEDALPAASRLARRYLSVCGPATPADIAHFFGAKVSSARAWIEELGAKSTLLPVTCGERKGLVALAGDIPDLTVAAPADEARWPLRLLPPWDTMLMAHADKSWTTPNPDDRKPIWRKAAVVAAVVVDRGRPVATWAHAVSGERLTVTVTPLSGWNASKHKSGLRREAAAVAAHLELGEPDVVVGS